MTVYVRGMAELQAKLARLAAAADEIADAAIDIYAEGIAEDARTRAPVDTGRLRDSITVTEEGVEADVEYAAFVEFGTDNAPSQPFMRPAADTADQHTEEAAARAAAIVKAVVL